MLCLDPMAPPRVLSGLDVLDASEGPALAGRSVALLAHAASVTHDLRYAWEVIRALPGVRLRALFSPEHGLMGTHQDMEGLDRDPAAGGQDVPVHSLYGSRPDTLAPARDLLSGVDLLVADIQDVGSRYYTYLYTLAHCMEVCREEGVEVWVLDRPNPLGGRVLEGNLLPDGFRSFVGRYPLPVRHGMTVGELASLINEEHGIGCALRVLPMQGWRRRMWFDHTGMPWVMPSPNMPSLDTATVYPGGCLIEGTNLSEGRGTTRPFEIVGAPWIDPDRLARDLAEVPLPGVAFRPLWFRPTFQKHAGQVCGGVQVHVTDRARFRPFITGVHLLRCIGRRWPGAFDWRREPYEFEEDRLAIDLLAGGAWLRELVETGGDPAPQERAWAKQLRAFRRTRKRYLLYP